MIFDMKLKHEININRNENIKFILNIITDFDSTLFWTFSHNSDLPHRIRYLYFSNLIHYLTLTTVLELHYFLLEI
jgi:hypothetical protein